MYIVTYQIITRPFLDFLCVQSYVRTAEVVRFYLQLQSDNRERPKKLSMSIGHLRKSGQFGTYRAFHRFWTSQT